MTLQQLRDHHEMCRKTHEDAIGTWSIYKEDDLRYYGRVMIENQIRNRTRDMEFHAECVKVLDEALDYISNSDRISETIEITIPD